MTNKEAIQAALQVNGYSETAVDKGLIDAGLNADDAYSSANAKAMDFIAIDVLKGMLSVERIQEGGYSITYSIEGVKLRLNYLLGKYKLLEKATLKDKSYLW